MPSLYLLYRLDGRTVIPQLLKLEIKVIQPGNKLHFRRVSSDDNELLPEDSFDDKPAAVMLRSCLTKHLLKADILLRGEFEIIPVDSGICRCRASDPLFCGCHQSGSLSGVTRERHPASQSEHLSYAENFFGIRRYSSLASSEAKNPRRKNFRKIYAKPPLRLPRVGRFPLQYYNHAGAKTNPRYGLERSGADIGTEVFLSVVSCSMKGRFSYSVHYPDINRIKRKTIF